MTDSFWKEFIADYITDKIYPTWPNKLSDLELTSGNRKELITFDKKDHSFASAYLATVAGSEEFCNPEQLEDAIKRMHLPFPGTIRLLVEQMKEENF